MKILHVFIIIQYEEKKMRFLCQNVAYVFFFLYFCIGFGTDTILYVIVNGGFYDIKIVKWCLIV